ncbi:MAG: hypothetical protein AAF570_11360 [Bacteroidota bacterium]
MTIAKFTRNAFLLACLAGFTFSCSPMRSMALDHGPWPPKGTPLYTSGSWKEMVSFPFSTY